jgi:hypothetical protein
MINFRESTTEDDALIAKHFYQLWQDNNVAPDCIRSDWLDLTLPRLSKHRYARFDLKPWDS